MFWNLSLCTDVLNWLVISGPLIWNFGLYTICKIDYSSCGYLFRTFVMCKSVWCSGYWTVMCSTVLVIIWYGKSKLNGTCCRPGHCTTDWPVLWCRTQYNSSTVDNVHCVILSKAVIPNLGYAYPQGYHLVKMRAPRSLENVVNQLPCDAALYPRRVESLIHGSIRIAWTLKS
jgi:hypothetical protein